jgi:hypothetical protein
MVFPAQDSVDSAKTKRPVRGRLYYCIEESEAVMIKLDC